MNQQAFVLIGRHNPEVPGRSPFSPIGAGFCIDEEGLVATCWHTIDSFLRTWSTVRYNEHNPPPQLHEIPWLSFLAELGPPGELQLFPLKELRGNVHLDAAVLAPAVDVRYRPLPTIPLACEWPEIGQQVDLLGHHQPDDTPRDPDGMSIGWAIDRKMCTVLGVSEDSFFLDFTALAGMSGGPVCHAETGAALGMIVETWPSVLAKDRLGIDHDVTRVLHSTRIGPFADELRKALTMLGNRTV